MNCTTYSLDIKNRGKWHLGSSKRHDWTLMGSCVLCKPELKVQQNWVQKINPNLRFILLIVSWFRSSSEQMWRKYYWLFTISIWSCQQSRNKSCGSLAMDGKYWLLHKWQQMDSLLWSNTYLKSTLSDCCTLCQQWYWWVRLK